MMEAFESIRTMIIIPNNEIYCALSMQSNNRVMSWRFWWPLFINLDVFLFLRYISVIIHLAFSLKYLQLVGHLLLGDIVFIDR